MLGLLPLLVTGRGLAAPTSAAPSADGIGIRLLDVPKSEINDPRAREYIIDRLAPGSTIHRRIIVSNSTQSDQRVTLYAGGAAIAADKFVPAAPDELSGWIQVSPADLSLAPGTEHVATVTVNVPSAASAGERYATVWAQVAQSPSASHPVTLVSRVGIRVYLDVGTGGAPRFDFSIGTITATPGPDGSTTVRAVVDNTGQRAVDVMGTLSLTSADGTIHAGPYRSATALTLLPGASGTAVIAVAQALPPGAWTSDVTLASGTVTHTARGTITIGTASTLIAKRSSELSVLAIGLLVAAAMLVVASSAAVLAFWRRRRRAAAS